MRLRGLSIQSGASSAAIVFVPGTVVGALHIEQCRLFGSSFGVGFAVPDGGSSELYISDSVISENGSVGNQSGVEVLANGTATVRASLSNVKLNNNRHGITVESVSGSSGRISLSMRDSTAAGNSQSGIQVIAQGAPVVVDMDNVTATANSTGLLVAGAATRVLITRLSLISNFIGMSTVNSGVIVSYGDNHINNNISMNGAPTVVQTPQ